MWSPPPVTPPMERCSWGRMAATMFPPWPSWLLLPARKRCRSHWVTKAAPAPKAGAEVRVLRVAGSVAAAVHGIQGLRCHAKHFRRVFHHHVVDQVLEL